MRSILDEAQLDLMAVLESPLRNLLNKSRNHCWKLVILSVGDNVAIGQLLRKWLGLGTAEMCADGVYYYFHYYYLSYNF